MIKLRVNNQIVANGNEYTVSIFVSKIKFSAYLHEKSYV